MATRTSFDCHRQRLLLTSFEFRWVKIETPFLPYLPQWFLNPAPIDNTGCLVSGSHPDARIGPFPNLKRIMPHYRLPNILQADTNIKTVPPRILMASNFPSVPRSKPPWDNDPIMSPRSSATFSSHIIGMDLIWLARWHSLSALRLNDRNVVSGNSTYFNQGNLDLALEVHDLVDHRRPFCHIQAWTSTPSNGHNDLSMALAGSMGFGTYNSTFSDSMTASGATSLHWANLFLTLTSCFFLVRMTNIFAVIPRPLTFSARVLGRLVHFSCSSSVKKSRGCTCKYFQHQHLPSFDELFPQGKEGTPMP